MKLALILCLGCVYVAHCQLLGGYGEDKTATKLIQQYADSLRSAMETAAGVASFTEFKVVIFRRQIVAGTNYLMKIKVGDGAYIHALVFRSLQDKVTLTRIQTGKTLADPLVYFA